VELREERASHRGAPTIRKRLFGVFRRDGAPIAWEPASHGPGAANPYRTAAECIDFTLPVPSIFLTPAEAKRWGKARGTPAPVRPLADATMRRVARGVVRYVIDSPKPFIMSNLTNNVPRSVDEPLSTILTGNHKYATVPVITPVTHNDASDRSHSASEPINTITGANRGEFALIAPVLAGVGGRKSQSQETRVDRPFHTVTAKADTAVIAPSLVRVAHGERDSRGKKRGRGEHAISEPLPTQTASNDFAVACAGLAPLVINNSETRHDQVASADTPIHTITAAGGRTNQLIGALLVKHYGGDRGQSAGRASSLTDPIGTVTTSDHHALTVAHLAKHNGGHEATGQRVDRPVDTLVARDNKALVTSLLVSLRGGLSDHTNTAKDVREPAPTLTAGGTHVAEIRTVLVAREFVEAYPKAPLVAAFLLKYFGTKKDGCRIDRPLHTVTTKDRYALVLVTIDGQDFAIVDIGMRMLTPRELFLCQGFPPDYKIDITVRRRVKKGRRYIYRDKPLTKGAQVRLCGNSVCPPHAASIVRANYRDPMLSEPLDREVA